LRAIRGVVQIGRKSAELFRLLRSARAQLCARLLRKLLSWPGVPVTAIGFRFFAPGSPIARLSSSMIFHETMLNFGSELNF